MLRRNIERSVEDALADTPVVLVNGARQTGKSTLVQAWANRTKAQYLTLDDAATLHLASADPTGFIRNLQGPVVIDEIQKAPDLFPAIKLAVDRNRQPGQFLLTGSSNILTLPRLSESLAGRMEVIPLHPFSAGELVGCVEGFITRLFRRSDKPWKADPDPLPISARLVRGGYPEAVERTNESRRDAWLGSYVEVDPDFRTTG